MIGEAIATLQRAGFTVRPVVGSNGERWRLYWPSGRVSSWSSDAVKRLAGEYREDVEQLTLEVA